MTSLIRESDVEEAKKLGRPSTWMTHEQSVVYHKHRAEEIRNRPFFGRPFYGSMLRKIHKSIIASEVSNTKPLEEQPDGNLFTLRILRVASDDCSCTDCLAANPD